MAERDAHRPSHYRSYMLVVLTVVYAFNFTDRNVLSLLMQAIKTDLHLSDTQMGVLSGIAFAFFYSTLGIPIARWADRGNRISIIALTVGLWSTMVLYCGLATSYLQLLLARIGVAVGEAGCVPPAQSLIADYYTRSERPRAMSYYMLGVPLSMIVGFAIAGWINNLFGWRAAFIAVGAPGVLLTVLVRWTLREPRTQARGALRTQSAAPERITYRAAFLYLWRHRGYRHLLLGFTAIYFFSYGIGQWTPAFLIRTYHIDTGALGSWYALIWGGGAALGTVLGGALTSRYAAENERLQLNAMAIVLTGFIPLYIGIYLSQSIYVAFGLMMVGAITYSSMLGPLYAMVQGMIAAEMRAMAVAVVLLFSNLIGMGLGPMAVGVMSDLLASRLGSESLRVALLIWTPGYLWAVFHLLWARRHVHTETADAPTQSASIIRTPAE